METLPYSIDQLQLTIQGLETLSTVFPERSDFIAECEKLGWPLSCKDNIVMEFDPPCASPFLVDLYNSDSVAGGFIGLCLLGWDEYEGTTVESQKSRDAFDAKYIETVNVVEKFLGKPDLLISEAQPCQQSSVWCRQNAFIFVLQGADDIEGMDIRLWLEYFDGNDALPDSQVFDWLCQRHLSKVEPAD